MSFQNTPLKTISGNIISSLGSTSLPWNDPSGYPVAPGNLPPPAVPREFTWNVIMDINQQPQSASTTRDPGVYNGEDVSVGMWVANTSTGQAWLITQIDIKTATSISMVVQDVYRYNTFRDSTQQGQGGPALGSYIIFNLSDSGVPLIDPIPPSGVSAQFGVNLQSRFEYINLQYDYALYAAGNTFLDGDVIAADPTNHSFALSNATHRTVIGRVTSVSDIVPGWFTVNPVTKIVDNLDYLPGNVGDSIYASITSPGQLTTVAGGPIVYINLRKNTQTHTSSALPGPTTPGSVFQLNSINVTVGGSGSATDVISAVNLLSSSTGVSAVASPYPSSVSTNHALLSPVYGEVVLWAITSPAVASINGVSVTFNILSTTPGYTDYTTAPQMAQSINNASIPNITASADNGILTLVNSSGGSIVIVDITPDINGVPFAGNISGSGLALNTPASVTSRINFTAIDARAINFLDVIGTPTVEFGLTSAENGVKAAGLYIAEGLRQGSTTVVLNLTQLNALSPIIGDQAYVIDSVDATGNNAGEWSMWLFNGSIWIQTSNEDSSTTDAKSLGALLSYTSPNVSEIGKLSNGRRVSLITVEVLTAFASDATLNIGYRLDYPVSPVTVPDGLMKNTIIDLTNLGTYTTSSDEVFDANTDVSILATLVPGTSTQGQVNIVVTYV